MKTKIMITTALIATLSASKVLADDHSNDAHWVASSYGRIPKHAVIGGYEVSGKPLYICQARYNDGMHPGKMMGDNCNFCYGGTEVLTPIYQVLVSKKNVAWAPINGGLVPSNAINGGFERSQALYVCQSRYAGGIHPGKVVKNHCHISYAGNEVILDKYNVLVG